MTHAVEHDLGDRALPGVGLGRCLVVDRQRQAVLGAGAVYAPVGLATHYHTVQIHPYWADSLDTVGTIGAHRFYRWRGAAGRAAAFSDSYLGGEPAAARHAAAAGAR